MSEGAVTASASPSSPSSSPSQGGGAQASSPSSSQNMQSHSTGGSPTPDSATASQSQPQGGSSGLKEYKINGKVVKMTQAEADDYVSMSYAAQEKFKEAKKMREEYEKKQEVYKKNRIQAFLDATQDLSPDERRAEIERFYAEQYIEPESMSPQERALKERERVIAEKEAKYQEEEKRMRAESEEKETSMHRETLHKDLVEMLEKSGLPSRNKFFVSRLAFYMQQNLRNGFEAPKEMLIRQVQSEQKQMFKNIMDDSNIEQVVSIVGEDFINKLRKYDLDRIRSRRDQKTSEFGGMSEDRIDNGQKLDYSDVNKRLRDIRMGKY